MDRAFLLLVIDLLPWNREPCIYSSDGGAAHQTLDSPSIYLSLPLHHRSFVSISDSAEWSTKSQASLPPPPLFFYPIFSILSLGTLSFS